MPTIEQLAKILASEPDDPFTLYGMAQALAKEDRHVEAVEHYNRCLAADPGYHYAYYHKARALWAAGDESAAVDTLDTGLEKSTAARDLKCQSEIQALLAEYRG